jgi:hypothetical protein
MARRLAGLQKCRNDINALIGAGRWGIFRSRSASHRYASLYQQVMSAGGQRLEHLVRKYFEPRSQAFGRLLARGMRAGEFRRADRRHAAISIVAAIVFYFSAARVLQLLSRADAFSDANLNRRRQEVLDFIRSGLFLDPEAPVA